MRLQAIVQHAQEEQEARGAPVIRDLVEEAHNAIGIKEARKASERQRIELPMETGQRRLLLNPVP
jgi:hypothetical protein